VTGTLVDSNVLLDIFTDDPVWLAWSGAMLDECASKGPMYINPIIYAEVSTRFERIEELENALPEKYFTRLGLPNEAAFLAGKAFMNYKKRGGTRTATLPDFFIGAHAAVLGLNLLTRDDTRFRAYFPTVTLLSPQR
jgi:predicted nucleic acid-binding protein